MDQTNLQSQIDELKRRLDEFNSPASIPYVVDKAWQLRGFVKRDFFVGGTARTDSTGTFRLTIPGSTINSIALVTGYSTDIITAGMEQTYGNTIFGTGTTRFDITNPVGTTFRYTYDGTGTNPNINSNTLPTGAAVIILHTNFDAANQNNGFVPRFLVTGSGADYFEVNNPAPGVVENNVTIGSGSITGGPLTNTYGIVVFASAATIFSYVVFLFDKLATIDPFLPITP